MTRHAVNIQIRGGNGSRARGPLATRGSPVSGLPAIFDPGALSVTTLVTILFVVAAELSVSWALFPLGLFVLFAAPGYAATALLLGRRPLPSVAVNFALIAGLSVLINVLLGTALYAFAITPVVPLIGLADAIICTAGTFVQFRRARTVRPVSGPSWFRSLLALPRFRPSQRAAAYALFAGILVVLGVIGYLSTIVPNPGPDLSLTAVGPDGTSATLPTNGLVNATLTVLVIVQNNATAQSLVLTLNSTLVGSNSTSFTSIPWTMPLLLGPNITTSDPVNLTSGASESIQVQFQFDAGGDYAIGLALTPAASHVALRTLFLGIEIT